MERDGDKVGVGWDECYGDFYIGPFRLRSNSCRQRRYEAKLQTSL